MIYVKVREGGLPVLLSWYLLYPRWSRRGNDIMLRLSIHSIHSLPAASPVAQPSLRKCAPLYFLGSGFSLLHCNQVRRVSQVSVLSASFLSVRSRLICSSCPFVALLIPCTDLGACAPFWFSASFGLDVECVSCSFSVVHFADIPFFAFWSSSSWWHIAHLCLLHLSVYILVPMFWVKPNQGTWMIWPSTASGKAFLPHSDLLDLCSDWVNVWTRPAYLGSSMCECLQ